MISILRKLPRLAKSESKNGIRLLSSSNTSKTLIDMVKPDPNPLIPHLTELSSSKDSLNQSLEARDKYKRKMGIESKKIFANCPPKEVIGLSIEKLEQLKETFAHKEAE